LGSAEQAAPQALEYAVQRWGIEPAAGLKLEGCAKPMVSPEAQFSWCQWSDPNGMQELSVEVERPEGLKHRKSWDKVPWIVARGDGSVCKTE
jgi:hypothetical protein